MRRLARVGLPLALGLAAAGCNSFKYFDIHVMFDPATFSSTSVRTISVCKMTTSGADSKSFIIDKNCPPTSNTDPLDMGIFEYSSFADSGTITFKFEGFQDSGEKPECLIGTGMQSVQVSGETTIKADLTVAKTGMGCSLVTPPTGADAGM